MFNKAYEHTKFFTEECGQRIAGTPAVLKASDYIIDYYKANGIKTETFPFEVPVCNVTASDLKARIGGEWVSLSHTPGCRQNPPQAVSEYAFCFPHNSCIQQALHLHCILLSEAHYR